MCFKPKVELVPVSNSARIGTTWPFEFSISPTTTHVRCPFLGRLSLLKSLSVIEKQVSNMVPRLSAGPVGLADCKVFAFFKCPSIWSWEKFCVKSGQ